MAKNKEVTIDSKEAATLQVMGMEISADILKSYDSADPSEFETVEGDVWKGSKDNDAFFGVYVAKEPSNFIGDNGSVAHWHFFATRSRIDQSPIVKRVLGTTLIERALSQVQPGTPVQIEWRGETKNAAGQPVILYDVKVPKRKRA